MRTTTGTQSKRRKSTTTSKVSPKAKTSTKSTISTSKTQQKKPSVNPNHSPEALGTGIKIKEKAERSSSSHILRRSLSFYMTSQNQNDVGSPVSNTPKSTSTDTNNSTNATNTRKTSNPTVPLIYHSSTIARRRRIWTINHHSRILSNKVNNTTSI